MGRRFLMVKGIWVLFAVVAFSVFCPVYPSSCCIVVMSYVYGMLDSFPKILRTQNLHGTSVYIHSHCL